MAIFLTKESKRFVDVSLSFEANPVSGDLTTLTNERSINNSLRNLMMFAVTEIPFRADIGSGVGDYLFEIMDPGLQSLLEQEIQRVITYSEPRVKLISAMSDDLESMPDSYGDMYDFSSSGVKVEAKPDQNSLMVTIVYKIVGYEQVFTFTQLLEPTR